MDAIRVRELLSVLTEKELETVPIERSETIPSSWYTRPEFHDLELETVFSRTWQGIGHVSQLAEDDPIAATVAGNPLLVLQGTEGRPQTFYNVCCHRGGPLAVKRSGEDGSNCVLQCQYHGWTYRLDGSLRGVPRFDRTELFDKRDFGLIPVATDVWDGLVFVNLSSSELQVSKLLDGVADRIAPIDISKFRFVLREDYDVRCNWKMYVDNYLEGYHVPFVHPELCKMYDFREYTAETSKWYLLQHVPLDADESFYGRTGGTAFYYFLFPNFMLNILPGRLQTNLVIPVDADRCRVIFQYYYEDTESMKGQELIARDIEYSDEIQKEDIDICERVQVGLSSRAYDRGRLSPEAEQGVYHFQTLLRESFREWRGRAIAGSDSLV